MVLCLVLQIKNAHFHYYNKKTGEFEDRVDEGIEKLRKQGVEGMVIIGEMEPLTQQELFMSMVCQLLVFPKQ